ncbi:MAG: ATP-binding cassette domain-containing protein [Candidatus Hodgkinia cicadicola]
MLLLRCANITFKAKQVLLNVSLRLLPGELCVLIGKNGIGKSSLVSALIADSRYAIAGIANFKGVSILSCTDLMLARLGVFLAFQHPVEIPGVLFIHFIKLAVSKLGVKLLATLPSKLSVLMSVLKLPAGLLYRPVNIGFSGGERRMLELVQMIALEPKMCILDETDSGLDYARVRVYLDLVLAFSASFRTVLIVTHSASVINALTPDSVYCLTNDSLINIRRTLYAV